MNLKLIFLVKTFVVVSAMEISIDSFKPTPSGNMIDFGTLRLAKIKKNHFSISGAFVIKADLGNEKTVVLQVIDENGRTFIKKEQPLCEFCQTEKLFLPDIFAVSNMPKHPIPCPFPKGNYTVNNFILNSSNFLAPPGQYIAKWSLRESGKVLSSLSVEVTVSPL